MTRFEPKTDPTTHSQLFKLDGTSLQSCKRVPNGLAASKPTLEDEAGGNHTHSLGLVTHATLATQYTVSSFSRRSRSLSLSLSPCALWGVPTSVQDGKQRFASLFWGPINANAARVQFSSTKARPGARECSRGNPRPLKDSSSERKFLKKEISSREVPVAFSMATGTLRPTKRT